MITIIIYQNQMQKLLQFEKNTIKFKMIENQYQQLSQDYFSKCQDLNQIQSSFHISQIRQQIKARDLQNQFELIRALTETKKHKIKLRSNNAFQNKKNRYPQQAIFQHSRVVLKNIHQLNKQTESQQINNLNNQYINSNIDKSSQQKYIDRNQDGYINANYIFSINSDFNNYLQKIILTQAPIQSTVYDFHKLIRQEQIQCVVMLCNLIENGKNRCFDYIGNSNIKSEQQVQQYLNIKQIEFDQNLFHHKFKHIHYTEWPDKKVPSSMEHIVNLIKTIKNYKSIVIHCSAGLGRSGVIAAILIILMSEKYDKQKKLSVFRTVRRLRQYRFGAIQNSEQYQYLYKFFNYLNQKDINI